MICPNIPLKPQITLIRISDGTEVDGGIDRKIEKILERCQILTTPSFLAANYKIYASSVYAC